MTEKKERIIIGIDPGTLAMGYGVIRCEGNKMELLGMGTIHMNAKDDHQVRLKRIFEKMNELIDQYLPDFMAIEAQFFGKNVQSMLKLGRAQGVCMAVGLSRDIPVVEYSPRKIKQSITGNGNASKEQVAAMLNRLVPFENSPKFLDATDALAIAICHFYQMDSAVSALKGKGGWDQFVRNNPGRISSGDK